MKKTVITLIGILMLSVLIMNVSAENPNKNYNTPNLYIVNTPTESTFDFASWFQHTFNIQSFSILGKVRQCSDPDPDYEYNIANGASKTINLYTDNLCGDDTALIDVFLGGWNPFLEYDYDLLDSYPFKLNCQTSGGCIIQVYCCEGYEWAPLDQDDCDDLGFGDYHFTTCTSWMNGGYKCTINGVAESGIPFFKDKYTWCGEASLRSCWYGSTCIETLSQSCGGKYQGYQLYDSKPTCESNINIDNWVNSASECKGSKPIGCMDKRCVATASECGTCGCGTSCTKDSDCCQGNTCGMNGVYQKQSCISGTCTIGCQSGYTKCPNDARCVANVNTDCALSGGSKQKSMTELAFEDATPEQIADSMCRVSQDCSKLPSDITSDEYTNVDDYNWTITCKSGASILASNKLGYQTYLQNKANADGWTNIWNDFLNIFKPSTWESAQNLDAYKKLCTNQNSKGALEKAWTWLVGSSADKCAEELRDMPSGTCRATKSSSGCIWSAPHQWIGAYTKADCNTDLFIFIGGIILLLVLLMKFAG